MAKELVVQQLADWLATAGAQRKLTLTEHSGSTFQMVRG